MKRFVLAFIAVCISFVSFGQEFNDFYNEEKYIVKFLGIPVDGSKYEMMSKLKSKGFTYDDSQDNWIRMSGYFNGKKSNIWICEYNGKVNRIMVVLPRTDSEAQIKINFNNLVQQFDNNIKYTRANDSEYYIGDDEKIWHNINILDKQYNAIYTLKDDLDLDNIKNELSILPDSTLNQFIHNICDIHPSIKSAYEEFIERPNSTDEIYVNAGWKSVNHMLVSTFIYSFYKTRLMKQNVWFKINEDYMEYYICLYYDNNLNSPDGSEL